MDSGEPTLLSCLEVPFSRSARWFLGRTVYRKLALTRFQLYLDRVFTLQDCKSKNFPLDLRSVCLKKKS